MRMITHTQRARARFPVLPVIIVGVVFGKHPRPTWHTLNLLPAAVQVVMDFTKVRTGHLQTNLNKFNIVIKENHGLSARTGFWWLNFTFDYKLEKGIEVRITNFKYDSTGSVWTLEVVKCRYLGITNKEEMASFDMVDELINTKELARLQQCSVSAEKLRQYLETNVVPLVTKKIKYTKFAPQFRFFLSHKSWDKPAMRTFENGLKFLGYSTWIDKTNMPMAAHLEAALKKSIEDCDCFVAWLSEDYFQSEYCKAELLYAKHLGKIILPFGVFSEIKGHLTGELEFLNHLFIDNPESKSFFEVLRRIDETLFEFEKMAIAEV